MSQYRQIFEYPCSSSISCYPISISLLPGLYRFECWGASGGNSGSTWGGRGAYVAGTIFLGIKTDFLLFIGVEGNTLQAQKTFNGGGRAHFNPSVESKGASGGGATDIRLINNSGSNGLLSRIIVAAGGGGSESYHTGATGGFGGSYSGQNGISVFYSPESQDYISVPIGGNQSNGGYKGYCINTVAPDCNEQIYGYSGFFGFGGDSSNSSYGGGGGGGYFGGGGGTHSNAIVTSGAGGSSYISGHPGCLSYDSFPDGPSPLSIGPYHYSGLSFSKTVFKGGNESFNSPYGVIEIGHSGNGTIAISYIGCNICSDQYWQQFFNVPIIHFILSFC